MGSELALEVCLAVRSGELEAAQQKFLQLLVEAQQQEALQLIEACLLEAVRRQQRQLFVDWLAQSQQQLLAALTNEAAVEKAQSFLKSLSFVVCDRRLTEAQPVLAWLIRRFSASADAKASQALWTEILNLAARMARRGWRTEASFLLRLYLRELLKEHQAAVWQSGLLALQMHFVVYARWDGFTKACAAYAELWYLLLLLVRRADRKKYSFKQRKQYLLLSLRFLRGIITNVARSLMTDEMEIFRQLYQYFWQLAGESKQRRQQLQLLLQLAISYWQSSLPKSSKKQVRFLKDLLEPSLINAEYEALLKTI